MKQDENQIMDRFGRENCFKVPDGYFENLTENVMARLPKEPIASKQPTATRLPSRHFRWLAASVFIGVVVASSWWGARYLDAQKGLPADGWAANAQTENTVVDEMVDYTMMDNEDIYASLIENN